jgi:hypothetical protein
MNVRKIRFKGNDFVFVGGVIATQEAYENGRVSYACLMEDGNIYRYGAVIGKKSEIEYLDEIELDFDVAKAIKNVLAAW